jgi:hypothetical protein
MFLFCVMRLPFVDSVPGHGLASVLILASTAAAIPLLAPPAVQAQLVIVDGYEIKTVTGTFGSTGVVDGIDLRQQPWWDNPTAAANFATAVGGQLGFGNVGIGPFFAYASSSPFNQTASVWTASGELGSASGFLNGQFAYASRSVVSSSVPGPLPLLGAAAAFGYSRKLRKRIQGSRNAQHNSPIA